MAHESAGARDAARSGPLPLPDYDHMTVRALERHAELLQKDDLEALVRYETAHENRTPVILLLLARLRHLRETGGDSASPDAACLRPDVPSGGYGPAPAASRPGHSIPGLPATGRPEPARLPPPGAAAPEK